MSLRKLEGEAVFYFMRFALGSSLKKLCSPLLGDSFFKSCWYIWRKREPEKVAWRKGEAFEPALKLESICYCSAEVGDCKSFVMWNVCCLCSN